MKMKDLPNLLELLRDIDYDSCYPSYMVIDGEVEVPEEFKTTFALAEQDALWARQVPWTAVAERLPAAVVEYCHECEYKTLRDALALPINDLAQELKTAYPHLCATIDLLEDYFDGDYVRNWCTEWRDARRLANRTWPGRNPR